MNRHVLILATALTSALGAPGCTPKHIETYTPKRREYEIPKSAASQTQELNPGSLYSPGRSGTMLFSDMRAMQENDLVVVRVEEIADARRSSDTALDRTSRTSADINAFVSRAGVAQGGELSASSDNNFRGEGSTSRTERLIATVPALVRKVLPNGNLFIEGHRVVLVNSEEQHFYISGVIRPIDIEKDNSVKSSSIADAEVEFTGQGVLTDNQRQGFVQRFFGWLWPF